MKILKHTPDNTNLRAHATTDTSFEKMEVSGQEELTFQLRKRAETNPDESAEFSVPLSSAAFCKVGRNRHGSPPYLRSQAIALRNGKAVSKPVD
jgi:hypothetical protein